MKKQQLSSLPLAIFVACLLLCLHQGQSLPASVVCYPGIIQRTCLMGCLSCWESFGGQLYDVASCCKKCYETKAYITDDGPSKCSIENVKQDWLKRFG